MTSNRNDRVATRRPRGRATPDVRLTSSVLVLLATLQGCGEPPMGPEPVEDPPVVASVKIDYLGDSLVINGQTASLSVSVTDASGNTLTGRTVTWTSSNTAVAEVTGDATGAIVTGRAAGTASISALVDNVPGTAGMRVVDTNVPALAEMTADLYGRAAAGRLQGGGTVLPGVLDEIATALDQKNVSAIRDGIVTARGALIDPASPDDIVLYSVVDLFVDHIERLLGL